MNRGEGTRQQLDPASMVGLRGPTIALVAMAVGWGAISEVAAMTRGAALLPGVLGLLLLVAAGSVVIVASEPLRAPFAFRSHVAVHLLALFGYGIAIAGADRAGGYIPSDWGAISLGLLVVAISPNRPARELVVMGSASAVVIGILAVLSTDPPDTDAPPLVFAISAMVPLLGLCYGSARYSHTAVTAIERWQRRSEVAAASLAEDLRGGIIRSVEQDRVTILRRDVAPYFESLLVARTVNDADRSTARAIADSVRRVMVAEVDRSWLENVLREGSRDSQPNLVVNDPDSLAGRMDQGQRTALRAVIVAVAEEPAVTRSSIRLSAGDGYGLAVFSVTHTSSNHAMHAAFDPYLAVMRIAFTTLTVENSPAELIARFTFDHP